MMRYYEVLVADGHYHSAKPLTYESEQKLDELELVSVPVRNRFVNAFALKEVRKPNLQLKSIKGSAGARLPLHSLKLAEWLANYYSCTLGEALQLFAPTSITPKKSQEEYAVDGGAPTLGLEHDLSSQQQTALRQIKESPSRTILLHGDTGSGKTRVYLELIKSALAAGQSAIILTPEIALTTQLAQAINNYLTAPLFVIHSQLTPAIRRKLWLEVARATEPVVIVGPRSALFSPVKNPGLVILDEAHEPAYKQDQAPRYHASRVASQLATLTKSKVILGSATPLVADYYLASEHKAVVSLKMSSERLGKSSVSKRVIDLRQPSAQSDLPYISKALKEAIVQALAERKQVMIYLNRRGSARQTLCVKCGWRLLCPRCDIPMVYHADHHKSTCHTCGLTIDPPVNCPACASPDVIYKSAGTKALADSLTRAFSEHRVARFDSDNQKGETVQDLYKELKSGKIDILVGTQLLAKGLDLPKLGLVGVITADTALNMPDFTASERAYQLLYQVNGRVGRGHGAGSVIVQTYAPDNPAIKAAVEKDWANFYETTLAERQQFDYPPYVYMLKLVCRRSSPKAAQKSANSLKEALLAAGLPVRISGPTPAFASRRRDVYYWQLVVKSKQRKHLLELAKLVKNDWSIDLDPTDLL